jgi:anti-sigma factor RsiW
MSQADITRSTPEDGALPDEGMIHEWLDGQLDATTSAQFDALVQSNPQFAARVAEARGLIAASSRILGALDSVPADVLPAEAPRRDSDTIARLAITPRRKPVAWTRWGSIAALLMIGVTGVFVANREPVSVREINAPAIGMPEAVSPSLGVPDSALPDSTLRTFAAPTAPDLRSAEAARDMPAVAPQRAPLADNVAAKASEADVSLQLRARATVASPESLASPLERTGGRVAADPAQRPSISAMSVVPAAPSAQRRFDGAAPAAAGAAMMRETEFRDANFVAVNTDIQANDLVVAVQRVRCTPTCQQTRIELATDGRLRRWLQATSGSTPNDTAHVAPAQVTRVQQLIVSLDLASLPAMLRLQGSQCTSVGNLRESLRVEFTVDGNLRSSMGLPWCSNGSHPLDRIAAAVEQLANEQFANGARR